MGEWLRSSVKVMGLSAALAVASPALAEDVYQQEVADQATKLQPISAWNLDYGEDSCRLTRAFGSKDAQHIFAVEQFAPDRGFQIIVAGPELAEWNKNRTFELGLRRDTPLKKVERFSSGEHRVFGTMLVFRTRLEGDYLSKGEKQSLGIDLDLADGVERAVLHSKRGILSFETGEMRPAFEALNACTRDLLIDWGLDAETHGSFSPPYTKDPDEIFDKFMGALPNQIRKSMGEESFKWRLIIDEVGAVESCHNLRNTGDVQAQSYGCKAFRRLRFVPAKNAAEEAMRSYTVVSLTVHR